MWQRQNSALKIKKLQNNKMYKSFIGNIFLLNSLTQAVHSTNFLKTLNEPLSQILDSFKSCTIRMVFLENSFHASEDVLLFLQFYQNQAAFILESIPSDSRRFKKIRPAAASRVMQDMRFITNCYTIFYFQDNLFDATSISDQTQPPNRLIYDYFLTFSVSLRNEDPTYIVFMNLRSSIVRNDYDYVKYIDTTSSFYVLAFTDQSVRLICVTCKTLNRVKSFSESTWKQIQIQTKIPVTSVYNAIWDTDTVNSFDSCGISHYERFTSRTQPYPRICFFREIKQRLNTTDSRKHRIPAYSEMSIYSLYKGNIDNPFKKHSFSRFVLLPYGMRKFYYGFGAVTRSYGYDINSLVKPFDFLTWSFLIASFLSLCLYFRICFRITNKRTLLETHVFSILMEQSQDIVTECGVLQRKTCGLLVCWMLLVFLVGNAYKGVLFTILTTLSFPAVPKTLQEVTESDSFVISTAIVSQNGIGSEAKYEIGNIVEEASQGRLNISNVDLYKKLNNLIVFLGNDVDISSLFVAMEKGDKLKGQDGNYTAIPKNLIIFDRDVTIDLFKELNSLFTTNTMLVLGQKIDLIWLRAQWLFRRNAIARLASPILINLVESGIYERWQQYSSVYAAYTRLYYAKRKILDNCFNVSNSRIAKKDNIIAYLLFRPYTAQPSPETEEPITMDFFSVFAQMLCCCLALCSFSLLVEKLSRIEFVQLFNMIKEKMCMFVYASRNGIITVAISLVYWCTSNHDS